MAKGMSFKVLMQLQTKEFQKGIKNIQRQLRGFAGFIKSAFALGSVTMFGKQMVQVGKDFENAMARVQAVSNATTDEFKKMQAEAQRLGSTTRYTATEAAEALENLTRNGMTATNATEALSGVLQLAQANSIGLADAANIVTNTLNMFNLGVNETNRVNDVLSSTASHAATDITLLYEAMVNAAPAANVLGFSIEEVSSAIGALAQRGVKGAEAGTKMRIALQKMADPKVVAKMKAYGIEVDENTIKTEGLRKTLEKIANANLSLGQLGKIFDAKSAMAVQMLVSSLDDLDRLLEITANSAGETARMFDQSVGSVQGELDTLKSMYEGLLISISKKTSGVVKGVVKLLQNLIANFDTLVGTITNIASVVVPLLGKRVVQLATTMKTAFAQIAAGATTVKAALGGWISIIATVVTWVATALVGAWNKAHKAIKDANKQIDEARIASDRMKETIEQLNGMIGDGSDKGSLNYAVKRATELFPEFAKAINDARNIAAKTGEWETLKSLLQDIADLQQTIADKKAYQAMYDAQRDRLANEMLNASTADWYNPGDWGKISREITGAKIKEQFEKNYISKEGVEAAYKEMAQVYLNAMKTAFDKRPSEYQFEGGDRIFAQHQVYELLSRRGVKVDNNELGAWLTNFEREFKTMFGHTRQPEHTRQAIETGRQVDKLDSIRVARTADVAKREFDNAMKLIVNNDKKANEDRYVLADTYLNKLYDLGLTSSNEQVKEAESIVKKYEKYAPKKNSGPGGSGSSESGGNGKVEKTDKDYIEDAINDYNEGVKKLDNRLSAGTITQKEYNAELDKLEDKTWEAITAFSNFSDILASLGKKDLGDELAAKYKQNRFEENTSATQKQLGALADYTAPKKQERDTRRDYLKSDTEKKEEEVRIAFDYADALDKLVKDFQEAIDKGQFDLVKEDAIADLENLKEKAKDAANEAETLQDKLDLSEAIAKLDEQIKNLESTAMDSFETFSSAMDRVLRGLMSIAEIFDEDLKDSPFFQGMETFMSALDSGTQIIQAFVAMSDFMAKMDKKNAAEKVKNAVATVAANEAATTSELKKAAAETTAAAAGAASSVANIPWIGPALAVAAVASVLAAIAASANKFAEGGIVGGSSYTGDHNIIRANSGEIVLNKHQQASLWNMINGKGGIGGGQVDFRIRGTDLIGVINNEQSRRRG